MIDSQGRVLCDQCYEQGTHQAIARIEKGVVIIRGRHHGHAHVHTVSVYDLLPKPGTAEYAEAVAELMRRHG